MEKLSNKTTDNKDGGLLKALAIAFPEAKIAAYSETNSIRFHTPIINDNQFYNLGVLLKYYEKQVDIKRSSAQLHVEIKDKEATND